MEPSGLAWTSLWQIFVDFFNSSSSSFIHTHSLTTTIRPALEDSPSTGLRLGGGLHNQWRCGKTRGWVGRGLFVTFRNVSVSSQTGNLFWIVWLSCGSFINKWVHRAPTLTWFRSLPCEKAWSLHGSGYPSVDMLNEFCSHNFFV